MDVCANVRKSTVENGVVWTVPFLLLAIQTPTAMVMPPLIQMPLTVAPVSVQRGGLATTARLPPLLALQPIAMLHMVSQRMGTGLMVVSAPALVVGLAINAMLLLRLLQHAPMMELMERVAMDTEPLRTWTVGTVAPANAMLCPELEHTKEQIALWLRSAMPTCIAMDIPLRTRMQPMGAHACASEDTGAMPAKIRLLQHHAMQLRIATAMA